MVSVLAYGARDQVSALGILCCGLGKDTLSAPKCIDGNCTFSGEEGIDIIILHPIHHSNGISNTPGGPNH